MIIFFIVIGGPLIVQNVWGGPGDDVLVGLVSWGVGCAFLPGVFSRVSASYDWIQTTVCEESSDPSPSLCGLRRLSPTDSVSVVISPKFRYHFSEFS